MTSVHRPFPRRLVTGTVLVLLAALVAAHFAITLQKSTRIFLDTDAYIALHSSRPFQYRLLMAPVLHALLTLLQDSGLSRTIAGFPVFVATPERFAYAMINAAACFIALLALWPLTGKVFARNDPARTIAMGLFLALNYWFFCLNPNLAFTLPYDIPAIAFTVSGLLLARSGRWLALFPLFALATLNRETIILLPIAIAIRALFSTPSRSDLYRALALIGLWGAIKLALAIQFAHLPTDEGLRLTYNVTELLKPVQWPAIFVLPLLAGACVLAARRRDEGLPYAVTALIGSALLFAVAQITETRAFGELIPYLALALSPMIRDRLTAPRAAAMPIP